MYIFSNCKKSKCFGRIALRGLCPQLGSLRHRFAECGRKQLESGHCSGTMADVAKKIREYIGVEAGYHAIPKSREGLLKFQPKLSDLPNRSMTDSQTSANVLLESDALLRQRFAYAGGLLRMGRMMEELDLLAGNVDLPSACPSAEATERRSIALHFRHPAGGPRALPGREVQAGCGRLPVGTRFVDGR
ncbi:uncharacterized protein [Drosophila takahashii]|uniref:uncharacterized protein isoform X2 n=1 Tax=Drosophila takahashii TaxID=29030 RepID=UPI0038994589